MSKGGEDRGKILVVEDRRTQAAQPRPAREEEERPVRILAAEDSPTQAARLTTVLEDHGFEVDVCASGAETLQQAASKPYDLAVLDVVLPDITGYEVCRRLGEVHGSRLPVILLTSLDDPTNIIRGLEAGANNFLVKPFQEEQLLSRIDSALTAPSTAEDRRRVPSVETSFRGEKFTIASTREHIVDYLMATLEDILQSREMLQKTMLAEKAAQEGERFLQSAVDALSGHIAILDEDGVVLSVNEAWRSFARANGYSGESAGVGLNYLDVCEEASGARRDDAVRAAVGIMQIAAGDRDYFYLEYACHSPDEERWFALRVTRFQEEEPVRVVVAHENITERRMAEETIRLSEERLRESQRIAHVGSWGWEVEPDEAWWSDEVYRIFGIEPAGFTVSSESFLECVHPDDRAAVADGLGRAVDEGVPYDMDHRIVRPDGTERIVHERGEAKRDESGRALLMFGTVQDVTEEKMADEALRRSEEEYRGLVEHATHGIYRSTSDGKLLLVNPALVDMLGYDSEAELLALDSIEELYVDPRQRIQVVAEAGAASGFEGVEVEWKRKDGGKVTLRLAGHQIEDARGTGAFVAEVFVEDVTERLSLEEQLRQAQRLEALGQLAGGVAHDFNNILSVIIVEAQLGMRRLGEDDPVRERLSEIKAAGERAADLTRQLLAFSRKQVIKPVVLSLNGLVSDLESMLTRLIAEDIHLSTALDETPANILAHRGQLEQILTNLVVNARDAMPRGGELTIRTFVMMPDEAFLRTHPGLASRPHAVLEVQDTGTGIPDDVKAKVFDPFFTTKGRGKGTGLGLATVYGIIQKMDGHIDVESELEVGTTMRVYIPIVDEAETEVRSTEDSPLPLGTETVLVVEDDVRLRRIAVQLLEEQGYTVMSAEDGPQALQQLGAYEGDVHLLLTDVVMPKMGGREVAQRVSEMRPEAKVLYMSGYTDDDILNERLTSHDITLLQKPFTAESLTAAVRSALEQE